ncbi:MAG: Gfo/Idh/MocA family oxidoreductase [Bacilli bacterium]|nr:Gfo/Idh/MocA family oxidoreductase [Bacilli bacterium]
MEKKILTVAILGVGNRGAYSYGTRMMAHGGYKITSLCDIRKARIDVFQERYGVDPSQCFTDEDEFFKEKRADALIIATQDRDHVRHAIKGLKLGYDLLLEKPITPVREECLELLKVQKETGKKILVCHVLRYAPSYLKLASLLNDGTIGRLVDIQGVEQVAYWHQAHSFVRGNWRKEEETSPMILAKCCHDMDLIQFWVGSRCKSVSSMGGLTFFNKENMPSDATPRCADCPRLHTCPYSAYRCYVEQWEHEGCPADMWPQNVVCIDPVLTKEGIIRSYENNEYGRCVFACDNDVVDHQETNLLFENGVTVNLCMTAFTGSGGRIYRFHGTVGEIVFDEELGKMTVKRYGQESEEIPFKSLCDVTAGHGGGDSVLINNLYDVCVNGAKPVTTIEESIESHLMAYAAEESRKNGGKLVDVH